MAHMRNLLFFVLLAASLMVAGCNGSTPAGVPDKAVTGNPGAAGQPSTGAAVPGTATETIGLTIYYANADAEYLVPEKHTVAKNDHPARTAIEQLLTDPANKQLVRVLPATAKLRNLTVKDHIAYVDFTDKLIKDSSGGSTTERLLVSAIVNTLTEFPDIHKVQILIEGRAVETLTGHMDVSQPLSRSEGIIKKSK